MCECARKREGEKFVKLLFSLLHRWTLCWFGAVVISLVYKSVCDDVNYCNIKEQEINNAREQKRSNIPYRYYHETIKAGGSNGKTKKRTGCDIVCLVLLGMLRKDRFFISQDSVSNPRNYHKPSPNLQWIFSQSRSKTLSVCIRRVEPLFARIKRKIEWTWMGEWENECERTRKQERMKERSNEGEKESKIWCKRKKGKEKKEKERERKIKWEWANDSEWVSEWVSEWMNE